MFQVNAYTNKRIYLYKQGGIIPKYDTNACEAAEKDGRYKDTDEEDLAFIGYGSSRVEAMKAVERLSSACNINVVRTEFVDW